MTAEPTNAAVPLTLAEFAAEARAKLTVAAWEYLDSGAADEHTLRANRAAFEALSLHPRVLRDVSALDTSLELLGQRLAHPVLVAPTGYHGLFHPDAERATARGAAAAHAVLTLSSFANTRLEDVVALHPGGVWFQLYVQRDREATRALVQRAEAAGCRAIVVTVDTPVLGARDREHRIGFALPEGLTIANFPAARSVLAHRQDDEGVYASLLDPTLDWHTLHWLRGVTRLPIVLKGVLSPDDAGIAADGAADGVIVSNHGGRNLDTVPAALEALPRVAEAVADRIPVLMDGGIRRGTDVAKALALGARAVLVGRPVLWGLAVAGETGVRDVLATLVRELKQAMSLLGCTRLAQLDGGILWHA
ncbi:MAG TPA: alpha-hydroxy acid oxidase [Candidatus Eisenbacteria bacterium]|nr:alpha-hydroxy acid oxidase [Candidatus Eisenbacteria bacterium]